MCVYSPYRVLGLRNRIVQSKTMITHYLLIISNYPKAGLLKNSGIKSGVQNPGFGIAKILKTNEDNCLRKLVIN